METVSRPLLVQPVTVQQLIPTQTAPTSHHDLHVGTVIPSCLITAVLSGLLEMATACRSWAFAIIVRAVLNHSLFNMEQSRVLQGLETIT